MMFEKICKQYLIRLNRAGKLEIPLYKTGKSYYDDSKNKANAEFDVVSEDKNGFIFYKCTYRNSKITNKVIESEIRQVKRQN